MAIWKFVGPLAAIMLAGCAAPSKKGALATDWESPEFAAAQKPPAPKPSLPSVQAGQPSSALHKYDSTWLPLERWCGDNKRPLPVRLNESPAAYSLSASNGLLLLRSGSTSAFWDGLEVRLGFPPHFVDGHLLVHGLDFEKTLDPLVSEWAPPSTGSHPVIVIDPGHGGNDPGARAAASNYFEKDLALDWALRLAPLLKARGWHVFLTRTNDNNLALSNRVAFAEERHAGLFVSLHFNSSQDARQQGIETYCLTPPGMQSSITRGDDDISARFPNNAFDAQNLSLAYRVHSELVRAGAACDRAVRRARFPGVLRNQKRPAILVEGGYISNPDEAGRIASADYRQKLAEAVARALCGEGPTVAVVTHGSASESVIPGSQTTRAGVGTAPFPPQPGPLPLGGEGGESPAGLRTGDDSPSPPPKGRGPG